MQRTWLYFESPNNYYLSFFSSDKKYIIIGYLFVITKQPVATFLNDSIRDMKVSFLLSPMNFYA